MTNEGHVVRQLNAKRREQTPQALARLVVVGLFVALWFVLWVTRIPMPVPFLLVLLAEALFFLVYWRTVFLLPSVRAVERAQYTMLGAEIIFHTTMVYFLGSISWLGPFAYVFGLIFTNTFLDMRRGLVYTSGASLAFTALIVLEATGTVPHYVYMEQGAQNYTDAQFVTTTIIAGGGVFLSIYLWVNWVGDQLRRERDAAVRAQDEVLSARAELERVNTALEERVSARTVELEQANAALAKSETKFRTLAETETAAVVILKDGKMLYVNSATEAMTGYSREELLGLEFRDTVHPDSQAMLDERREVRARGEDFPSHFELQILTKNGEARWLDIGSSIIEIEGSEAVLATAFDVTERKQVEEALRESETKFRTLAETVTVAVFILRGDKMLYVNSAAETLSGYTRGELLEMNFWDAVHPEVQDSMRSRAGAKQRGEPGPKEREVKIVTKAGQERWVEFRVSTIMFEGEPGILGAAFDITERKRAEEALREQARRDPLTGLLNRRAGLAAIEEQLERAKGASGRFAILALDIDRFKAVNDTFSHEAGDQALVQLAGLLTDLAGDQRVVCRMGGDEFEIGLEDVGLYQAVLLAEELRASLQRSLESAAKEGAPRFTISIGVACYPQEGENVIDLRRSADRAMYAGKAAGGNTTRAWRHLAPRRVA